jgi:hypothetical protein
MYYYSVHFFNLAFVSKLFIVKDIKTTFILESQDLTNTNRSRSIDR